MYHHLSKQVDFSREDNTDRNNRIHSKFAGLKRTGGFRIVAALLVFCTVFVAFAPSALFSADGDFIDLSTFRPKKTVYPKNTLPLSNVSHWEVKVEPFKQPAAVKVKNSLINIDNEVSKRLLEPYMRRRELCIGPPQSGMAVVSWFADRRGDETDESAICIVSLKHGKGITKSLHGKLTARDIAPDGKRLAVSCAMSSKVFENQQNLLYVLRIDNASCEPLAAFAPFDDAPNSNSRRKVEIKQAQWLDDDRICVMSENQTFILLDITTGKVVYGFKMPYFLGRFVLSPDRKHLVFSSNEWLVVFDAATGKQLGCVSQKELMVDGKGIEMSENIAFSPNGRIIAFSSGNNIGLFDFSKGKSLGSVEEEVMYGSQFHWVDNQHVFTGQGLLDARDRKSVLKFENSIALRGFEVYDGKILFLIDKSHFDSTQPKLLYESVFSPNPERLAEMRAHAKEQVMGPGDTVSVEFDLRLPDGDKRKVEEHILQVCQDNGWVLSAPHAADFKLKAWMGPPGEERELRWTEGAGMWSVETGKVFKFRPYSVGIIVSKGETPIFATAEQVYPPRVYDSEAVFESVASEMMREKPDFFLNVNIPASILREHMSQVARAEITAEGIHFP